MMTNQDYPTTADSSARASDEPCVPPLDQINPNIGSSIQLQIGNERHFATLIGYLKDRSVIVALPDDSTIRPAEGQPLIARLFSDNRAYAFDTAVTRAVVEPYPHLHLSYPTTIRTWGERQYERLKVNIKGTADISSGRSYSCLVRDISMGGALIALNDQTGVVNDPLLLTLRVAINGVEYELSLDSEIRSVRRMDSPRGDTSILQGLAFYGLTKQDILALAAFDLLPGWSASA